MIDPVESMSTPVVAVGHVTWSPARRSEPVTIGIPFPQGVASSVEELELDRAERVQSIQARVLDRWPDGSIRWALVDCRIEASDGHAHAVRLRIGPKTPRPSADHMHVAATADSIRISTGRATFGFSVGGSFPVSEVVVGDSSPIDAARSGLEIHAEAQLMRCRITAVQVEESGPLRVALQVRGSLDRVSRALPLEVFARVEAFSESAVLRIAITIRNTRRAAHPGGRWTLGDSGSLFLTSAVLALRPAGLIHRVEAASEFGESLTEVPLPFEIYQESSGGDQWRSPVHRERDGTVTLRFPGYRRREGSAEHAGRRATPIVVTQTAAHTIEVAVPDFWQNFPRSIAVEGERIEIGLFPSRPGGELHELQGGEQKSQVVVVSFADDTTSHPPLAWVHDPLLVYPSPDWCCESGAIPFLIAADHDPNPLYRDLAPSLDPGRGFLTKRELIDEYGWRNFGDLVADHESAFLDDGRLFVSHYNNQYDALACFATQFLRTGDRRWWQLMGDLASHTRDIDIYHTNQDRAAYNGGLFWHSAHYVDAGTSTHRSYPQDGPTSGGPSAEHNYNAGLMLHYFLTGDPASRGEAVNLANWVIAMEDGTRTVFRWLASGATGHGSATGSADYHGPGRGAANSILACLVALRLTGERTYSAKADELIRRCIGPRDDIDARQLLDVERRWYYTVFLQVLGSYLHEKASRGSFDDMYFYARESLLHYARWMERHERPYLDHPEGLEFPNETWAAQDLRKADALMWAALHTEGEERQAFLKRASYFQETSRSTLLAMPTHRYTRPTVLVLSGAVRIGWHLVRGLKDRPYGDIPSGPTQWSDSPAFEPQKVTALRRGLWLTAALSVGLLTWAVLFIAGA